MGFGLGLDYGTSYTAAAFHNGHEAASIPLEPNSSRLVSPSVVFVSSTGEFLFGESAAEHGRLEPFGLVRHAKRRLGDERARHVRGSDFSWIELVSAQLKHHYGTALAFLGEQPNHITITHPANWSEVRLDALKVAAASLGVESIGVQAEPDAAAVYHASLSSFPPGRKLAVYDFGGGTFDAAVIEKSAQGLHLRGNPAGANDLGGADLDELLRRYVIDTYDISLPTLNPVDLSTYEVHAILDREVERARERLSVDSSASFDWDQEGENSASTITVQRTEFEDLIRPEIERTIEVVHEALASAKCAAHELDLILLVGGTSQTPLVREMLSTEFDVRLDSTAQHPKLAVALGAAVTASAVASGTVDSGSAMAPPTPVLDDRFQGVLHVGGSTLPARSVSSIRISVDLAKQQLTGLTDTKVDLSALPQKAEYQAESLYQPTPAPHDGGKPEAFVTSPASSTSSLGPLVVAVVVALIVIGVVFFLAG